MKPTMKNTTRVLKAKVIGKSRKGFAVMKEEDVRRICRMGGKTLVKRRGRKWMQKLGAMGGKNSHGGHKRH